jgi:KDO2-lipid IV(A) lauroyltransferase
MAKGKGVLLAAAHFFCHEMGAAAINLRHPIVALVRESKDSAHQEIKDRWYLATGMEVVRRSRQSSLMSDTLAYLRVLRANKVLAITPDLPMADDKGVPVRLLGRDVVLPSGLVALSLRSGAPLVPCWGEWLPDRHGRPREGVIRFDAPLEFPSGGNREATIQAGMQEYATRLEDYLRRFPENWMFWLDKRWTRIWQAA